MKLWTVDASGTQTATGAENILYTQNTVTGDYVLWVDIVNLAAGDELILRTYQSFDGSNYRLSNEVTLSGTNAFLDAVTCLEQFTGAGLRFSLQQTAGTNRNFPWQVLTADQNWPLMAQIWM